MATSNLTSTLTVNTANTTPTGTYTFHVKATIGANCQGKNEISTQQLTLVVTSATQNTNTALASDNNPSTYGNPVKITATVTGTSTNPSGVGSVTFKDGATTLCNAVALTGNKADCTTSALGAGSHNNVTAVYSGGTGYNGSTSPAFTQTVKKKTLTVTANPQTTVNFEITKKQITITPNSGQSKTYGDADPTLTSSKLRR